MRTLLKYSALLVAAMVLLPIDGIAQGRGQGQGGDQFRSRDQAQVERGQTDRDRDRIRDQDRIHQPGTAPAYEAAQTRQRDQSQQRDQVQEQKQLHAPGAANAGDTAIYGRELMTVQERNRYREQLQQLGADPEQKTRFLAQHREQMQARAKAQGVAIDDGGELEEAE